jgi:hypothetical protein
MGTERACGGGPRHHGSREEDGHERLREAPTGKVEQAAGKDRGRRRPEQERPRQ